MAKSTLKQAVVFEGGQEANKYIRDHGREIDALKKQIAELNAVSREGNAEFKKGITDITQYARTVKQEIRTPMEEYRQSIEKINAAYAMGKLSQDERIRGIHSEADKLRESTSEINKQFDALSELRLAQEKVNAEPIKGPGVDILKQIEQMALGYLSVDFALQAVNKELEHKKELEKDALTAQVQLADAQRNLAIAMPGHAAAIIPQLGKISGDNNIPLSKLTQAVASSSAFASMYGSNQETGQNALDLAAHISPNDANQAVNIAYGTMRVGKYATGSQDPKTNLGYMLQLQGNTDLPLNEINDQLTEAVKAEREGGATLGEATGMVETLRDVSGDTSGRVVRNAAPRMTQFLRDNFPGMSISQAIAMIQKQGPVMAHAYAEKIFPGDPRTAGAAEQILTQGSAGAQEWAKTSQVPSASELAGMANSYVSGFGALPGQAIATSDRQTKKEKENRLVDDKGSGVQGSLRDKYEEYLEEENTSGVWYSMWQRGNKAGPWITSDEVRNQLGNERKMVDGGGVGWGYSTPQETQEHFKRLEDLIRSIDDLVLEMRQPAPTQLGAHQ